MNTSFGRNAESGSDLEVGRQGKIERAFCFSSRLSSPSWARQATPGARGIEENLNPYQLYAKRGAEAASPSLNLRKLVAEGTVGAHLNTVLRLVVGGSLLLVSVRNDHELDRFLLEKQKHESSAKMRKTPPAACSAISSSL